jgi:translation initiation factor IF-2
LSVVDHGKTTLLDSLRKASVAATEAGGITQKLSAFGVDVKGRQVVFLDTPGHAAFTAMRANGAAATDIVILVIAADDGVRPQTKEAIRIAKNAGCTIMVALNKMDKISKGPARETARLRVLTELLELDLLAESFGGEVVVAEVSGKTGEGLDALVESVLLQADVLDLKASAEGHAECTVLEACMEKGRGVMCDVLVRWGRLRVGDTVIVGTAFGKVKAMTNDRGKTVKVAGPSSSVRLLGLRTVPSAGQELISVETEGKARQIAERRERVLELRRLRQTLDAQAAEVGGEQAPVEVNLVLKADGQGTLNALTQIVTSLQSRTTDVAIKVASGTVGDITRTDVESAANMTNAFVLGFNVGITDTVARELAKELDVTIYRDTIIYRLEDALTEAMVALMPKERHLELEGKAKIIQVFNFNAKKGPTLIAGVSVVSGSLKTTKPGKIEVVYRIYRNGNVLIEDLGSAELKRFKDVVYEVGQGNECGLSFDGYKDFIIGDEIECYRVEWKSKPLKFLEGNSGVVIGSNTTAGPAGLV